MSVSNMEQKSTAGGARAVPAAPPPTTMLKPRSKVDQGGAFSVFRSIGSHSWNKRFCNVAKNQFVYGKSEGSIEKSIPFELISFAKPVPRETMKEEQAPDTLVECGWCLKTDEKEYLWACNDAATRDAWVDYIVALCESMRRTDGGAATLESAVTAAEGGDDVTREASATQEPGDDDEEGGVGHKTRDELRGLVAAQGDEEKIGSLKDLLDEDDDDDDELSQPDDDAKDAGTTVFQTETREEIYKNFLLQKAQQPYNHIAYKLESFKDYFKKEDGIPNVLFARSVQKIAKRDNIQARDIVITRKFVYLFAKGRFRSINVRVIDLDQLVGVIESSIENNVLALIIPSFHDIMLRIHAVNSVIPGSEVDVKHQLIAHLFAAHKKIVHDRPFIFREVENVRGVIRRSVDDSHLPLTSKELDALRVATNPHLYPNLRTNADSIVYFSVVCIRVNVHREQHQKVMCLTDTAMYLINREMDKVTRRTAYSTITRLLYDTDTQTILVQAIEVDTMLVVKNQQDFEAVIKFIPEVCKQTINHSVKVQASHQLWSVARMVEQKTLLETFGKGFEKTGDGFRMAVRLTQRLMVRTAKLGTQSVAMVGRGIAVVGKESAGLVTKSVTGIGEKLVDNRLTGGMLNVFGAAGDLFTQQLRLLFESILTLEDWKKQASTEKEMEDTLQLQTTPVAAAWRSQMGTIFFSSRCRKFDLSSHLDTDKTSERLIVLAQRGIFLFDDPSAGSGSLFSIFSSNKSLNLDELFDWKTIKGIIRCHREGNLVALRTSEDKSIDVLLRIPNVPLADAFVAHFCRRAMRLAAPPAAEGKPQVTVVSPVYKSGKLETLKLALKRSVFDSAPTIALRSHQYSDQMRLSINPDVADTLRRYGDNTVLFSGVVYRFRNSVLRKCGKGEFAIDDPKLDRKKTMKPWVLVISNCALYVLTMGYEISRRTEIRDIERASLSTEDPDAVLIWVPSEFDVFVRVEGRAKELIERVQDAAANWTDFSFYLPKEPPNSHDISKYTFEVAKQGGLARAGNILESDEFENKQSRRNRTDVVKQYLVWFYKDIRAALEAVVVAPEGEDQSGGWEEHLTAKEARMQRVYFTYSRAFEMGYRPTDILVMVQAEQVLEGWKMLKQMVSKLSDALMSEDVEAYEAALEKTEGTEGLSLLLRAQKPLYRQLRKKKDLEAEILDCIRNDDYDPNHVDIDERVPRLCELFTSAEEAEVNPQRMEDLKLGLNQKIMQTRLARYLASLKSTGPGNLDESSRELLLSASIELGIPYRVRSFILRIVPPLVQWATKLIETSMETANPTVIQDSINRVKKAFATTQTMHKAVRNALQQAHEQIEVIHNFTAREAQLQSLCARLRTELEKLPSKELESCAGTLQDINDRAGQSVSLRNSHLLCRMYLSRVREELNRRERQAERKLRDAKIREDYVQQMKRRENEQQRAVEEAAAQAKAEGEKRRKQMVHHWTEKLARITTLTNRYITGGDSSSLKTVFVNCSNISNDITVHFDTFPEDEQGKYKARIDHLQQALHKVADACAAKLESIRAEDEDEDDDTGRKQPKDELPEFLLDQVQDLDKKHVIQYVQEHLGLMTPASIEKLRTAWAEVARKREWISTLHRNIHTGVALKSIELLRKQVDVAKANGNYSDSVVVAAGKILESLTVSAAVLETSVEEQHEVMPCPQPMLPNPPDAAWPPAGGLDSKGGFLRFLYQSLLDVLNATDVNVAGTEDPSQIRVPAESTFVRRFVQAIAQLIRHGAAPSGFFSKTPRTTMDVIQFAAQTRVRGQLVAKGISELLAKFEEIKKYNNPHGHSTEQILIHYMLLKGQLINVISELGSLPEKEAKELFTEQSLHRDPVNSGRVRSMCDLFMRQVEWSFEFTEELNVLTTAGGPKSGQPTFSENYGQDNPVPLLRKSVELVSKFFSAELNKLGKRPPPEAIRGIFDENATKGIGIVVRENLCVAINNILLSGFQKDKSFFGKLHPWEVILACAEMLRKSSRTLGGVGIPDAVELVQSLTDPSNDRRGSASALKKLGEAQLFDVRLRMFYMHSLNQHTLPSFLDNIFEPSPQHQQYLSNKFYALDRCCMFNEGLRREVMRVLKPLSSLPFALCIDAEIW